jgi:hypothetical protein
MHLFSKRKQIEGYAKNLKTLPITQLTSDVPFISCIAILEDFPLNIINKKPKHTY